MLKILIFEDDKDEKKILRNYLSVYFTKRNIEYELEERDVFPSDLDFLLYYDILFLDIKLNEQNGINFGHEIKQFFPDIIIIITSKYPQYLIDGYKINATRYLLKPINQSVLEIEMDDILSSSVFKQHYGFYDENVANYKIHYREILYIEFSDRKTHVHLINNKILECQYSLRKWNEILQNKGFAQSYKSFIINFYYVTGITSDEKDIILSNNERIPISKHYKKSFQNLFYNHIHTVL